MIRATKNELLHGRDKGRVLLVSDSDDAPGISASLKDAGFVVVGVSGGAAALVQARRTRPHVIVAASNPKGITSVEFVKHIVSANDGLAIVLIGTGEASQSARASAMASGAFDYYELPGEMNLLLKRVEQLVNIAQVMERLRAEADRDYLTGLANRRRFRSALGAEVERWRRYKQPCSLLIADLDHLKVVNDTFGHSAGDVAIRHIAGLLSEYSRDNDTAARLGGEEFALLLAGTDIKGGLLVAERIRESVAGEKLDRIGTVTVSFGVASCPDSATNERELYAACDAALYTAKREGRNRCSVAPSIV